MNVHCAFVPLDLWGGGRLNLALFVGEITVPSLKNFLSEIKFLLENGNTIATLGYSSYVLARSKKPRTITVGDRTIYVRPASPDLDVVKSSLTGEFDSAIKAAGNLHHGMIVDAGGYIGTAAIAFAEAFPNARVITLEPSHSNFDILLQNVRPYANIIPINKAIGATLGSIQLRNRGTGEWGFSTVPLPADCPSAVLEQEVSVTTIDALLQEYSATGIDLLKLDIEGAEFDLLKEQPEWIDRVRVIVAELHDRIKPGCTEVFNAVAQKRSSTFGSGEKIISVKVD
jgi:FkbM family methyltransferase